MANNGKQPLLPAYLVNGADELKRNTVVSRLVERLGKEGDLSFNSESFSGEAAEGDDIVTACNTLPFASNVRLVQVDFVEKLKKADQELLVQYLDSPCETTVLCLVSNGLAKNTRLYKAVERIGKNAVIDCAPPKLRDLPAQVWAMAATHGVTITPSAASLLVEFVGESTVALDKELDKLSLAHRGAEPINDSEIASLVSRSAEPKPWEFVDAFSGKNLAKCLVLYERMESTTPFVLFALCVNRIRELIATKALQERGQLSTLPSLLNVPDWRVRNHPRWAELFERDELIGALSSARDTERAMKSGANPKEAFIMWACSVIAGR